MAGGFSRRLWPFILMLTWLAGIGTSEASAAPLPSTFTWCPCPEAVPAEQAAQVRCGVLASRYAAVNSVTPWCSIWTGPALDRSRTRRCAATSRPCS